MTCHTTTQDSTWKKFVEGHLLKDNVIDGVSIISKLGEILYTYGKFTELSQVEVQQFLSQFENTKKQQEETRMQKGFHLNVTANNRPVVFYIHKKTRCSVYAISEGSHTGLLVGNLPLGILLCTYAPSHSTSGPAIKHFEQFCDLLRS